MIYNKSRLVKHPQRFELVTETNWPAYLSYWTHAARKEFPDMKDAHTWSWQRLYHYRANNVEFHITWLSNTALYGLIYIDRLLARALEKDNVRRFVEQSTGFNLSGWEPYQIASEALRIAASTTASGKQRGGE